MELAAVIAGYAILLTVFAQLLRERAAIRRDQNAERGHWRSERAELTEKANANAAAMLEHVVKATQALPQQLSELEAKHAEQLGEIGDMWEVERVEWRGERRELLNRIQHPTVMPTVRPRVEQPAPGDSPTERARRAWQSVGVVAPPRPDGDDASNGLGDEVP